MDKKSSAPTSTSNVTDRAEQIQEIRRRLQEMLSTVDFDPNIVNQMVADLARLQQHIALQQGRTTVTFQVSARTARLIGRENVATGHGAIIELVKNSYDADSDVCIIVFDT